MLHVSGSEEQCGRCLSARRLPGWLWLFVAMAVAWFVLNCFTPLQGDDWGYASAFGGANPQKDTLLRLPGWWFGHWWGANGRVPNLMMAVLACVPRVCLYGVCALAFFGMFWAAVRVASAAEGFWPYAIALVFFFVLPWQDYLVLYVCQLSYLGGAALVLVAYMMFMRAKPLHGWGLAGACVWCLFAGSAHEAASLPLVAGIFVYFVVNRRLPRKWQWWLIGFYCVGLAQVMFSPALFMRVGGDIMGGGPDAPFVSRLLWSCMLPAVLWLGIAMAAFTRGARGRLRNFFAGTAGVFAVAALLSMVIAMFSGIIGRSGWFAQVFAVISIAAWGAQRWKPEARWVAVVTWVAVFAEFAALLFWQIRIKCDFDKFDELYAQSADGVVFMDAMRDSDIPLYTLGRLRALPDADDVFLLEYYAIYHRRDCAVPTILPADAAPALAAGHGDVVLGNGDRLCAKLPSGARRMLFFGKPQGLYAVSEGDIVFVARKVRGMWYMTPLELDWGDKFVTE